jgi:glutamine amidotransferase/cyclase
MVQKGNVVATQFHPEKSGAAGLAILGAFLARGGIMNVPEPQTETGSLPDLSSFPRTQLVKRVIACLDVRSNDAGDLVVTKGDQYDVREAVTDGK